MTKTVILTYYINVDGLSGEDAQAFVNTMKSEYAAKPSEFPSHIKLIQQWFPVSDTANSFQVDIID